VDRRSEDEGTVRQPEKEKEIADKRRNVKILIQRILKQKSPNRKDTGSFENNVDGSA
jgi:hypothetical protein